LPEPKTALKLIQFLYYARGAEKGGEPIHTLGKS